MDSTIQLVKYNKGCDVEAEPTAREEVEVAVADKVRVILGVLVPDGKLLDLCIESQDSD